MKNWTNILFVIIFLTILNSCKKNETFLIQMVNETNYELNEVEFDWYNGDNTISLAPFQSSEETTFVCEDLEAFGPCLFSITILSYSDSARNYQNLEGFSISRKELSETRVNKFVVNLNSETESETNIFEVLLE